MTSRERFEKLADELGFFTKRAEDGVWYDDPDTDRIWIFFQAGERQALERAAQRLDEHQKDVWHHNYWHCAANIVRRLHDE